MVLRRKKRPVHMASLSEIQVVGTPGEGFGACGEGYFRFSTFGSREDTAEAAGRLEELLGR